MPFLEIATHAVHFVECKGFCVTSSGVAVPQTLFLLSTCPESRKCASLENQAWSKKSGFASIVSQNHSHMVLRFAIPTFVSFCFV